MCKAAACHPISALARRARSCVGLSTHPEDEDVVERAEWSRLNFSRVPGVQLHCSNGGSEVISPLGWLCRRHLSGEVRSGFLARAAQGCLHTKIRVNAGCPGTALFFVRLTFSPPSKVGFPHK
jgi:hypothetical protein